MPPKRAVDPACRLVAEILSQRDDLVIPAHSPQERETEIVASFFLPPAACCG